MAILSDSKQYLKLFLSYLEVERNFSKHTIRAYRSDIIAFLLWLGDTPVENIKYQQVKEYLSFIFKFILLF